MNRLKEHLKLFVPPIMLAAARKIRLLGKPRPDFEGPYSSWEDAVANADGWDAPAILEKTLDRSLKMRDGLIEFQQDTVILDRVVYSEAILAFLAIASAMNGGKIDIVDFGGSLGTNFAQNRRVLRPFIDRGKCTWNVVERPPTADLGRKHFQDENLQFFGNLGELKARLLKIPTSFLFTGSLQCVDEPFSLLNWVIDCGVNLIAFDRLLVSPKAQDEVFVQRPNPEIYYRAAYPVRCFSRSRFLEMMVSKGFVLVEEFTKSPGAQFDHCGMIFAREKHGVDHLMYTSQTRCQ